MTLGGVWWEQLRFHLAGCANRFFWKRTVADDESRLQVGGSLKCLQQQIRRVELQSSTSCSHMQTSPHEPEACFIYILNSDWTVWFSGGSSVLSDVFSSFISPSESSWSRNCLTNINDQEDVCIRFHMKPLGDFVVSAKMASWRTSSVWVWTCWWRYGSKELPIILIWK